MIADETIDRVKREARIVAIVGERVKLTQRGRAHIGLCPFHKEKTPSFNVNEERGFYHCFGCNASGDAIKFLRELDGLSFVDAVRYIAERQGIEVVETGSDREIREQAEARKRREELYVAGEAAAAFFERELRHNPLAGYAVKELERRGMDLSAKDGPMADAIRGFRLGYAPYGWDRFATYVREGGATSVRAAEAVGLLVPRKSGPGHYDRFRHRLMFAIVDLDGKIVGFSGRTLDEPTEEELRRAGVASMGGSGDPPAKYLNSPESPVYKKREAVFGLYQARSAVRREDRTIVVEGNFDVVSLHARGIANVVAPLGTAFTEEQARQLRRYSQNVTLFFDADSAGKRAVVSAQEPCKAAGLVASVATAPAGKDPDELVRAGGPEAIANAVRAGRALETYLLDAVFDRCTDSNSPQHLASLVNSAAKLIEGIEDPAARAVAERHANQRAASLTHGDAVTLRAWSAVLLRAEQGRAEPQPLAAPPERARSRARRRDIALEILGALLDFPSLLDDPDVFDSATILDGEAAIAIAALRQNPALAASPEHLLAKLPGSIHPFAAARLAAPRHQTVTDAKAELLGNVEKLKRLELSRHKSEVIEELSRSSGDFDREMALLGEQARRVRERHGL
ncbi:MAG TPA: DNA primase [Polyangiaceae bacterium]|nr:DNA primase [Polyangiaceae bacterium]